MGRGTKESDKESEDASAIGPTPSATIGRSGSAETAPGAEEGGKQSNLTNGEALPAGWTEHFDEKNGLPYYYAASTGSTVWQRPTEPALPAAAPVAVPPTKVEVVSDLVDVDLGVAATTPATNGHALPAGWTEHLDQKSGLPYYYAASTGSTVWQRPTEPASLAAAPVAAPPTKVDAVSDLVDVAATPATTSAPAPAAVTAPAPSKPSASVTTAAGIKVLSCSPPFLSPSRGLSRVCRTFHSASM